jgi:iron complex outermembrane receptor protein
MVCLASSLAAQATGTIGGTVTDSSGHPIVNAQVQIENAARQTVTDSSGRFRLTGVAAGTVNVRVKRIGFFPIAVPAQVTAGESTAVAIVLRASAINVPQVIVTAAKRSQLLDQAVTSVELVPEQVISRRAVNTVDEALDRAPGVQLISGTVNVRGSTGYTSGLGSRVLLLVDGVPANQGDRGGINWDVIPVDQVDRVEVVKGAGSALYGSSAFGGVVNLITKDPADGWHARVRATGGAYANPPDPVWRFRSKTGMQDGVDVGASYGAGPFHGGLSAGARHLDGYREQDEADHWQAAGRGSWRTDPFTVVRLSGAWASDQYQVAQPWCVPQQCGDNQTASQPFRIDSSNAGNRTRSDKGYLTAQVTRTPSDRVSWLARASWLRTHFTDTYPQRTASQGGPHDISIANRYGLEGRLVSHPDPRHVVTVGVEVAQSDILSNVFSGDTSVGAALLPHSQGEYAAYAEDEQRVGAARITIGARTDFLVIDGAGLTAVVSPRFGAVLSTATGAWRASAGRGFRAASLAERFATTYALGFRVVPNPAIESEQAWTAELGRSLTSIPWLHADAALFWTEARRLIEPTLNAASVIQFQNLQRARLLGLDASLTAQPFLPGLTTGLAYQYLSARELATDSTTSRPLPFRPRHLLTLTADYMRGQGAVGADLRLASRFERVEVYEPDPRVGMRVLDLRASWTQGPLAAHFKLANALNYIYALVPRILEPVRTATLTLTYTY